MNFFFGYIWYRIARLYRKRDSDGITASAFLSLSQGLMISCLFIAGLKFTNVFTNRNISIGDLFGNGGLYPKIGVAITLTLCVLNFFTYRKKYYEFNDEWGDEPRDLKLVKGFAVIVVLAIPLFLVFAMTKK